MDCYYFIAVYSKYDFQCLPANKTITLFLFFDWIEKANTARIHAINNNYIRSHYYILLMA